ncbi:MAG: phosphotransferase [Calothrix sp. MO_192.B10]|nr:phosphotransferase [Calothrix sp. MO_192.B10]
MLFSLSSQNVIQYLQSADLCSSEDRAAAEDELPQSRKNSNFLVTLSAGNGQQLLVKQEGGIAHDGIPQELFNEWLFHQLLQKFPVLGNIAAIAPLVIHFDQENSILVRNYLSEYLELRGFYQYHDIYPEQIATAIGNTLGVVHRATFDRREYREFMATAPQGQFRYQFHNPAQGIGTMGPEILAKVPSGALKFYTLYQSHESISAAIADLAYNWQPCCLTHNDLKLENILVHSRWQQLDDCLIKFIDWEAASWGDPAFDLGCLLASYLENWLQSLVVDNTLNIEESLALALVPLELIQPSIIALVRGYLNAFPEITDYRRNFIYRAIQFAGLVLIDRVQEEIVEHQHCDRRGLCIFQVANNLLTMPQNSVQSIFGIHHSELIPDLPTSQTIPYLAREQNLLRIYYPTTRLRGC